MEKKKLLSLVLAVLMVFSTLVITPLTTLADDPDAAKVAEGYCFKIGTNYYKTLADAAATVAKGSTVTITQIADYSWAGPKVEFLNADTDVTLDLNGHTLARTDLATGGGNGALIWPYGATFTVKNGTMSGATVIDFRDDPTDATAAARTLNIENVTMTAYYMTAILVRASGAPVTVNVKNSTVIGNSTGDGPTVAVNGAVNATINFIGSTLESIANKDDGWGGNVLAVGSAALSATINFDAASTLRLASKSANTANTKNRYALFNQGIADPSKFIVNFAKGATVEYAGTGVGNVCLNFCNKMEQVTDGGIVWKVAGTMLNHGVKLPSFAGEGQVTLWTVNGKRFAANNFHMDTTVADDATLYTATYENVDSATLTGDEKEAYANGNYFEMGGVYYKDLAAVKAAMATAGTYTVKLLADNPDMTARVIVAPAGSNVTIDLNGHTLNGVAGWSFDVYGNLTVKNGNIRTGSGFDLNAARDNNVTVTLDGVHMHVYVMTGIGLRQPSTAGIKTTINIKDSFLTLAATTDGPSLVQYIGNDATWNLVNSTIVNTNCKGGNISAMLAVWGNATTANKCALNVDATSTLKNAVLANTASYMLWADATTTSFVTTLAAGATVEIGGIASTITLLNGTATVVDNGAAWKFAGSALKNGVGLPNFYTADTNHATQWTIGNEKFMGAAVAKTDKVTGTATATYKTVATAIASDADALEFGKVCRVGTEGVPENYFATLSDAIASVHDGEEKTVVILKDIDSAQISFTAVGAKLTVDGQNHKVTVPAADYWFISRTNSDLTIKNLELYARKGIIFKPGVGKTNNYLLENVKFYMDTMTGNGNGGIAVKVEQGASKITVKDSLIQMMNTNPDGPLFYIMGNQDTSVDLDIINSTFDAGQNASVADNNAAIYILKYNSVTGKDDPIGHGAVNIHVDGTSVLKNSSKAAKNAYVINDLGGSATKITLDAGAKLLLNVTSPVAAKVGFINQPGGNVTVDDKGAKFAVSGASLKAGTFLPAYTAAEGIALGYSVNGKLAPAGAAYKDETANDTLDYELTKAILNDADFAMLDGASMLLDETSGLRFETKVSKSLLDMLGANVKFGTILAMTEDAEELGVKFEAEDMNEGTFIVIDSTKWASETTDGKTFAAALAGIPMTEAGVMLSISARAFMDVTFADGSVQRIYSEYTHSANARSVYDVASALKTAGSTNEFVLAAVAAGTAA